jgi:hypothetical protein
MLWRGADPRRIPKKVRTRVRAIQPGFYGPEGDDAVPTRQLQTMISTLQSKQQEATTQNAALAPENQEPRRQIAHTVSVPEAC